MSSTPAPLRRQLKGMIAADLHGPVGGDHEQLPNEPVRFRYLVGMLAPKGTVGVEPARTDKSGVDTDDDADQATADDLTAAQPSYSPSSFGMTFAVDPTTTRLRVEASWGHYLKEEQDEDQRVWQRSPAGGAVDIDLAPGDIEPASPDTNQPDVRIRGRVTDRAGVRLVTLFLCNEEESPDRNKYEARLFQVSLAASPTDGTSIAVGRPQTDSVAGDYGDEAILNLQYRDVIEFAVGHRVDVHTEVHRPDPRQDRQAAQREGMAGAP